MKIIEGREIDLVVLWQDPETGIWGLRDDASRFTGTRKLFIYVLFIYLTTLSIV
jgi:hypothetical protein